eukprot:1534461-Alexandrium_andersonii.AAC.1
MVAQPASDARRRGDCPPHRLRQLPVDAWAELRTEYAALHIRFGIPRSQQERLVPAWGAASARTDADLLAQCAATSSLPPAADGSPA